MNSINQVSFGFNWIDFNTMFVWVKSRLYYDVRGVVGGWARGHVPPSVGNSDNFRKFENFISTAHVRDDVM